MSMSKAESILGNSITPDWPAPQRVRALTTTRQGGFSQGVYASFNLADHVNDNADRVRQNRDLLKQACDLPGEPRWLQQVHGRRVCRADAGPALTPEADAAWTATAGVVCAVLTADCLPVFFTNTEGSRVAVAHAGWRGLHQGVLADTLAASGIKPQHCLAWLGPAIGPDAFEVGEEVLRVFTENNPQALTAFRQKDEHHWLCDLYQLARIELAQQGVKQVYGGGLCTFSEPERFYSYRREAETGRMASLIWLTG